MVWGGLQGFFEQLFGRDDAGDQTGLFGFCRVHHAPGQAHVHGFGLADGARQTLRAASAGHGAELDFRLAELGGVGGIDHVAHHRHFTAAAQREAGDSSDYRLAGGFDAFPVAGDEIGLVGVHVIEILHEANVGSCGEGFFVTGDDDTADVFVGFEGVDRGTDAVDYVIVQCIHRFRAIDADQTHFAVDFGQDYLCHCCSPECKKMAAKGMPRAAQVE